MRIGVSVAGTATASSKQDSKPPGGRSGELLSIQRLGSCRLADPRPVPVSGTTQSCHRGLRLRPLSFALRVVAPGYWGFYHRVNGTFPQESTSRGMIVIAIDFPGLQATPLHSTPPFEPIEGDIYEQHRTTAASEKTLS